MATVELWMSQTADFKAMGDSSKAAKKDPAKEYNYTTLDNANNYFFIALHQHLSYLHLGSHSWWLKYNCKTSTLQHKMNHRYLFIAVEFLLQCPYILHNSVPACNS